MSRGKFIEIWNDSKTLAEVVSRTGKTRRGCIQSAVDYRKMGYQLKKMPPVRKREGVENRFWKYVCITDGCWEWTGHKNPKGYGQINIGRGIGCSLAHRISYEIHYGKFDDSMLVCHHCDNPACVKPSHLFIGTHKDNMQDAKNKGRFIGVHKAVPAEIVEKMRRLRSKGLTYREISDKTGVNQTTVWKYSSSTQKEG